MLNGFPESACVSMFSGEASLHISLRNEDHRNLVSVNSESNLVLSAAIVEWQGAEQKRLLAKVTAAVLLSNGRVIAAYCMYNRSSDPNVFDFPSQLLV